MDVHDAEVTGVRMDREKMFLQLELALRTGEKARVDFACACEWSLSRFQRQNVLFDIHEWKAGNAATAERCSSLGLDAYWTQRVLADAFTLYEVAPSVGVGGYVLACSATVIRSPLARAAASHPNVFDLLESIRKRPGMYLGGDDSQRVLLLRNLEHLLSGYSLALGAHGAPEAGFRFLWNFADYLSETRGWSASCGPISMIVKAGRRKHDVWTLFWKLVDEYRESLRG
ncbi:hypothetical protein [Corallococcus sp. EGB]|uniref:hypothetical protein n=1 Tax=Corallococcus sp. EGB TaxID=1521117 RepID=UPI001CBB304C|nr:hypothetical protein [Corallococcus sp. EGB]